MSQSTRQLKRVWLEMRPLDRRLELDYRDGVKTWAVQLGSRESVVRVSRAVFRFTDNVDEEESSDEEEDKDASVQQWMEEEEDEDLEEHQVERRGRGRPSKKDKEREARLAEKAERAKGKARAKELLDVDVQVKLNGAPVGKSDDGDVWECQIPIGTSILEVGEKGGQPWRIYMSRAVVW